MSSVLPVSICFLIALPTLYPAHVCTPHEVYFPQVGAGKCRLCYYRFSCPLVHLSCHIYTSSLTSSHIHRVTFGCFLHISVLSSLNSFWQYYFIKIYFILSWKNKIYFILSWYNKIYFILSWKNKLYFILSWYNKIYFILSWYNKTYFILS